MAARVLNLHQFSQKMTSPDFWQHESIICFKAAQYPLLFFSFLLKFCKQKLRMHNELIDTSVTDLHEIQRKLHTSFLGMKTIFWLRSFESAEQTRNQWLQILQSYQGPHTVVMVIQDLRDIPSHACIINLDTIDGTALAQIYTTMVGNDEKKIAHFLMHIAPRLEKVSIDHVCILIHYALVIGTSQREFINTWLDLLLEPEMSLYTLSQYLFSGSSKQFFSLWSAIKNDYAEPFWIIFWSEQFWRAYHVICFMQTQQFAEAKTIAYKLPFSFMQKDWKRTSVDKVKKAHHYVCTIDTSLKNGRGSLLMLEWLFSIFITEKALFPPITHPKNPLPLVSC